MEAPPTSRDSSAASGGERYLRVSSEARTRLRGSDGFGPRVREVDEWFGEGGGGGVAHIDVTKESGMMMAGWDGGEGRWEGWEGWRGRR